MKEKKSEKLSLKELLENNRKMTKEKERLESERLENKKEIDNLNIKNRALEEKINSISRSLSISHDQIIICAGVPEKVLKARKRIIEMIKEGEDENISIKQKRELDAAIVAAKENLMKICDHNFILGYHGWVHNDDDGSNIYRPHRICLVCGTEEKLDFCTDRDERIYKKLKNSVNRLIKGPSEETTKTPTYDPWRPWGEIHKKLEDSIETCWFPTK